MTTKRRPRDERKLRSKNARSKQANDKLKRSHATAAPKTGHRSAKDGRTTVIIVPSESGKYKVYGGKGGRIRAIGSKSTASRIAGRLGVKSEVFREVDRIIESLRLRKKIG